MEDKGARPKEQRGKVSGYWENTSSEIKHPSIQGQFDNYV